MPAPASGRVPVGAGRRRRGGESGPGGAGEGRARGSRGSPSGLGEAGRASGGGGSPAGSALSGERTRESAGPSRRSARSRSRQSARPRSLPGGSGAAAGCSLTCRPFPAGRRRRTEGRGPARHFSRSLRLGPRAGCRLHGDRARGTRLRTFGRGGEFLPRALCGEGTGPLRCVRVPLPAVGRGIRVTQSGPEPWVTWSSLLTGEVRSSARGSRGGRRPRVPLPRGSLSSASRVSRGC